MISFRLQHLREGGFSMHFLLPLVVVVGVAAIGLHLLDQNYAQTTCRSATYSYNDGITQDISQGHTTGNGCVANIQKMLNAAYAAGGAYHSNSLNDDFAAYAAGNEYTASSPAAAPFKGTMNSDGEFGPQTLNRVDAFQSYFANSVRYNTTTKQYSFTNLSVDGQVGPDTWTALCAVGMHFGNVTEAQYKQDTAHTGAYWEYLAYAAAKDSGCYTTDRVAVSPHGTTSTSSTGPTTGGGTGTLTLAQAETDYNSSTAYGSAICKVIAASSAAHTRYPNCFASAANAAAAAEAAYTNATQYGSATCNAIAGYVTSSVARAQYPNCFNTNARPSSASCKTYIQAADNDAAHNDDAGALAIEHEYPYCF
jgi:hypothetical protein